MNFLQYFNPFRKPTAQQVKEKELQAAQRGLIVHQLSATYHQKMAEYCRDSINRLQA